MHVNEVFRQHPGDVSIVYRLLLELSAIGAPICVEFNEDWFVLTPGFGKTVVEVKGFDLQLLLRLRCRGVAFGLQSLAVLPGTGGTGHQQRQCQDKGEEPTLYAHGYLPSFHSTVQNHNR